MMAASREYYGTAGTAFMEKLAAPETLSEIRRTIREGITGIVGMMRIPEGSAPEVGRIAARFALAAFAGELATRFGVTGWTQGDAMKAGLRCFNDWLNESGGAMGADEKALFSQVATFLQAHGASRFPPHDISADDLRKVLNRAGFSYASGEGVSYWTESGAFKRELCKGFNPTAACKTLIKAGWLEPGKKRTQQQKRIPALGGNSQGQWFYVITEKAIEGDV